MKRYGKLFDKIFTEEALYRAYLSASKGKKKTKQYLVFSASLGSEIKTLLNEIHGETYNPSPYRKLNVTAPKPRIIHAPCFRDVVVQHAIYSAVYPVFNRTFVATSMACRPGKGTHAASDYAYAAMQRAELDHYTLHLDVKRFFASINHTILSELLRKKIKDTRLLDVMGKFFGPFPQGVVLGNLLSQLYALIYLNPVDHFIKRVLKVDRYVRYVDDMMFIGLDKGKVLDVRDQVTMFLESELSLELSKWSICKVRNGINFVGYRTWPTHRLIRKYSLQKFKRAVRDNNDKTAWSIIAHAQKTSSVRAMAAVINRRPAMATCLPLSHKMRLGIC